MIRSISKLVPVLAALVLSGCIEYATLIDLKKDGSGTLTMRLYMSDQMASGIETMESMMVGVAGAAAGMMTDTVTAAESAVPGTFPDFSIKEQLEEGVMDSVTAMGEGLELVSSADITNSKGWPGYQAVFSFKDINTVRLGQIKMEDSGNGMNSSSSMGAEQEYSFRFTPGSPAVLEIISLAKKPSEAGAAEEVLPGMEQADEMAGAMMQMMAPMLQGMRMSALIKVDGTITETDAAHVAGENRNAVVVYDINIDQLLKNPEVARQMSNPAFLEGAEDKNIPGLRVHNPGRNIRVAFE